MTVVPSRRLRVIGIAVVVAAAVALVIEGVTGVVIGVAAGGVGYRWLSRQRSREEVAEDQRVATDLPFAADLLAAALRAGAAPDVAARCTGKALGGPLGERLLRVGPRITARRSRRRGVGLPRQRRWRGRR